jgi:hypothetical protein
MKPLLLPPKGCASSNALSPESLWMTDAPPWNTSLPKSARLPVKCCTSLAPRSLRTTSPTVLSSLGATLMVCVESTRPSLP